jgi:hypothetical protein
MLLEDHEVDRAIDPMRLVQSTGGDTVGTTGSFEPGDDTPRHMTGETFVQGARDGKYVAGSAPGPGTWADEGEICTSRPPESSIWVVSYSVRLGGLGSKQSNIPGYGLLPGFVQTRYNVLCPY